jgi:hypothetical protein
MATAIGVQVETNVSRLLLGLLTNIWFLAMIVQSISQSIIHSINQSTKRFIPANMTTYSAKSAAVPVPSCTARSISTQLRELGANMTIHPLLRALFEKTTQVGRSSYKIIDCVNQSVD